MKTTDKFLIGIVIAIVLIVVAAFAVTLARPEATYLPEDSPENVIHNYLLALEKKDDERAYSYLSPEIAFYPKTLDEFKQEIKRHSWDFRSDQNVSLSVQGVEMAGDEATVEVLQSNFYGGGLFDSGQNISIFKMDLVLLDGQWKIADGDAYFVWCWSPDGELPSDNFDCE